MTDKNLSQKGLGRSQSVNRVRSIAGSVGAYADLTALQEAYGSDFVKGLSDRQMNQLLEMDGKYVKTHTKNRYTSLQMKQKSQSRKRPEQQV